MKAVSGYVWDMLLFCKSWFNSPKQMGTIFPSSSQTGKKIADIIKDPENVIVVEVGAGTGQVTDEILKLGVAKDNFVAIEYDTGLCAELTKKHPNDLDLMNMDAADMLEKLPKKFIGRTDYLISTLPLIPMGREKTKKIIDDIFTVLKPNGVFVQVTLSPFQPKYIKDLGLRATKLFISWLNMPPMHVWRICKS